MKIIIGLSTGMLLLCNSVYVYAEQLDQPLANFTWNKFTVDSSLGWFKGKAEERSYSPSQGGRKISQLKWTTDGAAIVKLGVEWEPINVFSIGARGWSTLGNGNAQLKDFDWQTDQRRFTDRSIHNDTTLNFANEVEGHLAGWLFNTEDFKLGMQAGYQWSKFSWKAKGGSYNYNNGADIGEFVHGENIIGYKQSYDMPFIGLIGNYRIGKLEIGGLMKFSDWVNSDDHDNHYKTGMIFETEGEDARYYSYELNLAYYFIPDANLFLNGTWTEYTEAKGKVDIYNVRTNETGQTDSGAGGLKNKFYTFSAGLQYRF